jgi:hypothetical protein
LAPSTPWWRTSSCWRKSRACGDTCSRAYVKPPIAANGQMWSLRLCGLLQMRSFRLGGCGCSNVVPGCSPAVMQNLWVCSAQRCALTTSSTPLCSDRVLAFC